jgi:Metallo-beta-lactamase superfamily
VNSLTGNDLLRAPGNDEIEVSIFGPGYGETVIVHLGLGDWLIVDSCLDKSTNRPASVNYLHKIGVDPSSAVKILLASHWHDDHVGGLASVFEECQGAQFFCSVSLKSKEFLTLVRSVGTRSIDRGVQEFAKIVTLLRDRASSRRGDAQGPQWAMENSRLWRRDDGNFSAEIFALSPSSASMTLSFHEVSQLVPGVSQQKRRLVAMSPNQAAVVLWLGLGNQSIILGSDLEEEASDSTRGWSVIVDSKMRPTGMAQIFKIPHHGSVNAHHSRVWSEMLASKPLAVLTPFINGGIALPTQQDVRRICQMTPEAFSTARILFNQQKKRHGALDRTIKEVVRSIRTIPSAPGHVRLRRTLSDTNDCWRVELFDGAVKLSEAVAQT